MDGAADLPGRHLISAHKQVGRHTHVLFLCLPIDFDLTLLTITV